MAQVREMMSPSHDGPRPKGTPTEPKFTGRDNETGTAIKTFRLLAIGAAGMACLVALLPAAGHDQMWCLYAARLMRNGAHLYGPELFESNPPLIVWMSRLPVALASWLHVSETAMGKLLVLLLEAGVGAVCLRMLRLIKTGTFARSEIWAWSFVFVAVFAVMPARDFGQRDHILALLCLPYVLAAAMDAEGLEFAVWVRCAIGVAAGVGIALKPHQALLPVAVETIVMLLAFRRTGRWSGLSLVRPEPLVILGSGLLYLVAIRLFAADYFSQVVPVLRATYWAFGHLSWPQLVGESWQLHLLAAIVCALCFWVGWRRVPTASLLLGAAGVASTLAFYAQGTGWYYQQIPALSFFALALTYLVVEEVERRGLKMPSFAPKAAGALAVLAIALTTHFAGYPFTQARSFPIEVPDPSFFVGLERGTPVATLTTTVDDTVPPAFRYGLTLAQRYPHLWMLPAILRFEAGERNIAPERLARLEDLQHRAMVEDFARWKPQLVLVERCQDPVVACQVLEGRHDDLLGWFLRDPVFRGEFTAYRYARSIGAFDAYVKK